MDICCVASIPSLVGTALPSSSNFFINYVITQGVAMIPFRIMYPHIGVLVALFRILHICGRPRISLNLTFSLDSCTSAVGRTPVESDTLFRTLHTCGRPYIPLKLTQGLPCLLLASTMCTTAVYCVSHSALPCLTHMCDIFTTGIVYHVYHSSLPCLLNASTMSITGPYRVYHVCHRSLPCLPQVPFMSTTGV